MTAVGGAPAIAVPDGWTVTTTKDGHETWVEVTHIASGHGGAYQIPTAHLQSLPQYFWPRIAAWIMGFIAAFPVPPTVRTRQIDLDE